MLAPQAEGDGCAVSCLRNCDPVPSLFPSILLLCVLAAKAAHAQAPVTPVDLGPGETQAALAREQPLPAPTPTSEWENEQGIEAYFRNWFRRVALAQSEQPAWVAALVAPPPFLVEQMRYDQYIEHLGNDASLQNFGVNKGLQLIPDTTEEIDINIPQYEQRQNKTPATGFGDWQFALFKQRLLSAGPNDGNYVLSAWIAATAPTGSSKFTNHVYFINPNIGGGKGFGNFDVQATFDPSIPTSRSHTYGTSLVSNLVFQYRFEKVIWPEVEFNWTDWLNGIQHGGKKPGADDGRRRAREVHHPRSARRSSRCRLPVPADPPPSAPNQSFCRSTSATGSSPCAHHSDHHAASPSLRVQ